MAIAPISRFSKENTLMDTTAPKGELTISTVAMPADANPAGDVFGGWILSQMDIAGGIAAARRARGRCVTVAVDKIVFHLPVQIGDLVTCYADIVKVGRTSITVNVLVLATPHYEPTEPRTVTEGTFTYVALDENHNPRPVPPL
jgi:acyl-CoA thioesterase YciA